MLPTGYYYRDAHSTYPLQSHPQYWFHVGKADTRQVIMGLVGNLYSVVLFSTTGDFMGIEQRPLGTPVTYDVNRNGFETLHDLVSDQVSQTRLEWGLIDEVINIKRFWLPANRTGISDLPDDLHDYVIYSRALRPERDMEDAIEGWTDESLFAFWWDICFYVNFDGIVTSS
ncbi:MAG: hypothetical protein K2X82_10050 [Gemmataceae bacterium]|nr:hypothetical protein [Gemmataceae bacterium]